MRSDPLKNITRPVGPTPQSGFYLELRVERKNTTTELWVMQWQAQIGAVIALLMAILAGVAFAVQMRSGTLSPSERPLMILVTCALFLSAAGFFGYSRFVRRQRLNLAAGPAPVAPPLEQ